MYMILSFILFLPRLSGTELVKRDDHKVETPTSETVNLLGVRYGKTLALEYSDDPENPHAQLVLLPEVGYILIKLIY